MLCAIIFWHCFTKAQNDFLNFGKIFAAQMENSIDYRAVFGAIGRGISGEETVQQTINHVYMGVFGIEEEENQAIETVNVVLPTDISPQSPVNALLASTRNKMTISKNDRS